MKNPLKQLRAILGREQIAVAQVITQNADGTSLVQVIGGGEVTVSGAGFAPGTQVFIRDNQIRGAAPNLIPVDADL